MLRVRPPLLFFARGARGMMPYVFWKQKKGPNSRWAL